ncbi:hypothetical protein E2C01_061429 [Portunus trituberculatus]|uniref:Uncharacterized protein n=1 Tax=Portunus trituberculatus TaxID=210409 RepID=A0A5B7HB90_PORTR|nr:hypothetical protein [Portunus trituberculatus]
MLLHRRFKTHHTPWPSTLNETRKLKNRGTPAKRIYGEDLNCFRRGVSLTGGAHSLYKIHILQKR